MSASIRLQIISERNFIEELKQNKSSELIISDHQLPNSDQNFGLVETAAVIAIAKSLADLAHVLVKIYNEINNNNMEIKIKTATETINVTGIDARNFEFLMKKLSQKS